MKEELQSKLVEILSSIQATAGSALSQLPDVAQSYVAYGRAMAGVNVMFSLVILAISAVLVFGAIRSRDDADNSDSFFAFVRGGWWIAGIVSFVSAMCLCMSISDALMVWIAPKAWVLKELAQLTH